MLRCGCAGGHSDSTHAAIKPFRLHFCEVINQVRRDTRGLTNLDQALRIRTITRSYDEQEIGLWYNRFHSKLPVLCRIADILSRRGLNGWEFGFQRGDDLA